MLGECISSKKTGRCLRRCFPQDGATSAAVGRDRAIISNLLCESNVIGDPCRCLRGRGQSQSADCKDHNVSKCTKSDPTLRELGDLCQ